MSRRSKNNLSLHVLKGNALTLLLIMLPCSFLVEGNSIKGVVMGSWALVVLSSFGIWWAEK